ncbi:MAG: DNA-binding response regulator [Sphingobacteriia bacterium]|jgi:two-component system alkaline phosphatase synthesis response regulator PhoP|nr:DNA-binding response regulator [Sphingobacteriia bacterium]
MQKQKILIVDDEKDILELLEYNLEKEGYTVLKASDGEAAIALLKSNPVDMVLLDIMMPKLDGIETCRRMRDTPEGKKTYIVFLTAREEEYSELAGFEAGADDYIPKPIKPRILLSRIRAMFRRGIEHENQPEHHLKVLDLEIIRDEYLVYKNGHPISLPKKEFELLYFLAARPGKVFPREILLENIWGPDVLVVDRTIDVHIRKLREKLGDDYIQTIRGVGYKFALN